MIFPHLSSQFLSHQGDVGHRPPASPSCPPISTCRESLFPRLFPSPSAGPCLSLVNKVGKGPGGSSPAPPVPNSLNGHDTVLDFRVSATAGGTSAGRGLGPGTVSAAVTISLPVIRCHLEPAVLWSWVDLHNCPPLRAQGSLQALRLPALKQL